MREDLTKEQKAQLHNKLCLRLPVHVPVSNEAVKEWLGGWLEKWFREERSGRGRTHF